MSTISCLTIFSIEKYSVRLGNSSVEDDKVTNEVADMMK